MRNSISVVIKVAELGLILLILVGCNSQQKKAQVFYNEIFKWKITIPDGLKEKNPEELDKSRKLGNQAIEDTYGEKNDDSAISIFAFENEKFEGIDAIYEAFDTEINGDFFENCKLVNELIYTTLITQISVPIVIDTLTTIEQIDHLDFYVFKMNITYPNNSIFNWLMYSRLFNKQLFRVTITFIDEELGNQMLDAWKNSTFEK